MNLKSVIVCDSNINDIYANEHRVMIDSKEFLFGLIDVPLDVNKQEFDNFSVEVKINAFSCNYRDKGVLNQLYRRFTINNDKENCLYSFFGSEFVGEVIRVGNRVQAFQVGDRVISDNSYPQKKDSSFGGVVTNFASKRIQVFPESHLIKVPKAMSNIEAAAFSLTASTAHSIISKSNIQPGNKILVTSLFSNTSIGCLELLKNTPNIEIYALTTHVDEALSLMEQFKIRHVFSLNDFCIGKNINNVIFDVIIDPFADIHLNILSSYLNFNSRYISCGMNSNTNQDVEFYKILYNLIKSNSIFIGNCLGTTGNIEAVINEYNNKRYNIYIDSVYSEDQVSEFINASFNNRHFGKVVYLYK